MALGFVLTGHMTNLLIFTLIILIHEMGHYLIALRNGFNVLKITIYPYGGMTKLNYNINEKISKELEVAFGGIFFQIISEKSFCKDGMDVVYVNIFLICINNIILVY